MQTAKYSSVGRTLTLPAAQQAIIQMSGGCRCDQFVLFASYGWGEDGISSRFYSAETNSTNKYQRMSRLRRHGAADKIEAAIIKLAIERIRELQKSLDLIKELDE